MKYRKKPVEIEAEPWDGSNAEADRIVSWITSSGGEARYHNLSEHGLGGLNSISILTLEGTMEAMPGDWIIRGVQGEFYPCKPDIFEQTYEKVCCVHVDGVPADCGCDCHYRTDAEVAGRSYVMDKHGDVWEIVGDRARMWLRYKRDWSADIELSGLIMTYGPLRRAENPEEVPS